MPTGAVYRGMLWQLHPAENNISKVIIGISPWPMDVVELGEWWQKRLPIEVSLGK